MALNSEVLTLIEEEQSRSGGLFIPNRLSYLKKLEENAELITHLYRGKCLGFVFFYCNDPLQYYSYISLLAVSPESRKKGIASSLIKSVLFHSCNRGFKVCRLEVSKENLKAITLYRSLKFDVIEDRVEKYLMEALV